MSPFVVVILAALIGYRAARLLTTDSLFEGTRDRLLTWGHIETVVLGQPERSYRWVEINGHRRIVLTLLRGKVVDLVTCPYCCGFWLSMIAWFLLADVSVPDATLADWCSAVAAAGLQSLAWRAIEDRS